MFMLNALLIKDLSNKVDTNASDIQKIKDVEVYSTSEKVVGKWIDGKPLYQKTIQMQTVSAGTVGTYDISSLNCDTVWIDFGNSFAYSGEIALPINRTHTGNIASQSDVRITRSTITIICGSGTSAGNPIITIKYTKTTD